MRDAVPDTAGPRSMPAALRAGPVVLLWQSVGPYHRARAGALQARLAEAGGACRLVQLASADPDRPWTPTTPEGGVPVDTIAPGRTVSPALPDLSPALRRWLQGVRPAAIAVAGYDRPEMRSALRWGRRRGIPTILMSETKADDRPRPWWRRAVLRRVVAGADAGLVSGRASRAYLESLGMAADRIFQPYGVVDNDRFARAASARPTSPTGRPYFLASARMLEARKNLLLLLGAYDRYRRRAGDDAWDLVLCGDGPDRGILEAAVAKRDLRRVTLPGFEQIEAMLSWYAAASCFVHPARIEPWGLVVNEAMAAGIPVLLSRSCGCARDLLIEGETGFGFDPDDEAGLAELLDRVAAMTEAERRSMGSAGQGRIAAWHPRCFADGLVAAVASVGADRIAPSRKG